MAESMAASAASPVRNQRKVEDGLIITGGDGNERFSPRKSRSGAAGKRRRLPPICFHKKTNALTPALRAATISPRRGRRTARRLRRSHRFVNAPWAVQER